MKGTNGTVLNGQPITHRQHRDGGLITILVARRHQPTSIFFPLHKPLVQLTLAEWRELLGTLLQTARADRTVRRVVAQLFDLGFAFQTGSQQGTRIQPRYNWSFNIRVARPANVPLRYGCR
ncbi:MAG: hypothetical protein ABI604_11825 [Nitrospirota bacterium]